MVLLHSGLQGGASHTLAWRERDGVYGNSFQGKVVLWFVLQEQGWRLRPRAGAPAAAARAFGLARSVSWFQLQPLARQPVRLLQPPAFGLRPIPSTPHPKHQKNNPEPETRNPEALVGFPTPERDWYFIAEQPAPASHLAHSKGCAALRTVLVTVSCVSRSWKHFQDEFDPHLLPSRRGSHVGKNL